MTATVDVRAAEERLEIIAASAALRWRTDPVPILSHSNDTWSIDEPSRGPVVLRVGYRGDRGRLITESKVGRALPSAVGYPEVLGFGWTRDESDLTWSMTRRLTGCTLMQAWPGLRDDQRRAAITEVVDRIRVLHGWRPSGAISDRLLSRPRDESAEGIVGATINPLPVGRLEILSADPPRGQAERIDRAVGWLRDHERLAPALDRPGLAVTHQDLHLGQVWWDGSRASALLDLEWVRFAPPWTELGQVADNVVTDEAEGRSGHADLYAALSDDLGKTVDHLRDRLTYWRLASAVRQLFVRPKFDADSGVDHPAAIIDDLLC